MSSQPAADPRNDATLAQVSSHPLRLGFLKMLRDRPTLTPREAWGKLCDERSTLKGVNYHVWVLNRYGLVEPAGEQTDTGLPYRLTLRGTLALEALGYPMQEGGA